MKTSFTDLLLWSVFMTVLPAIIGSSVAYVLVKIREWIDDQKRS